MFRIVLIFGFYFYLIFTLGVVGLLERNIIIIFSLAYILLILFLNFRYWKININLKKNKLSRLSKAFLSIIFLQGVINLIGALGPELSFDSLWYHLTIPKIFLENNRIFHIPGNLLYYSDLPKNLELLYLSFLSFSNEVSVKLIHFSFGLLTLLALYKLSRKFLSQELSFLACVLFYSNLVVGWQSITSYVDLGRTFFELLSFYYFLNWIEKRKIKDLTISSLILGLAIGTKLVALSSVIIFIALIIVLYLYKKIKFIDLIKSSLIFSSIALVINIHWFIFSFINTGNLFYPFFYSSINLEGTIGLAKVNTLISDLYNSFILQSDPISPIYLIFIPLFIIFFKKINFEKKLILLYSLFAFVIWFLIFQNNGSRFILPYLPVISLSVVIILNQLKQSYLKQYLILVIAIVALSSISYRFIANYKYLPVIFGLETKQEFLNKNLNFSFGDFYDTDNYFKNNLKSSDKVLLYGFHNLYYVEFNYIDSSWVKKGDQFNYIAVQNSVLPDKFTDWKEVYYNEKTKVKLYTKEYKLWVY